MHGRSFKILSDHRPPPLWGVGGWMHAFFFHVSELVDAFSYFVPLVVHTSVCDLEC